MLDWKPLCIRRKNHFKLSLMCVVDAEVFRKILDIYPRVEGEEFTKVQDDDATFTFLIDLGYKGPLHKHPNMYVDHMHQTWRTLAAIINKCLNGKTTSSDRLRKSRIDILRNEGVKLCHSSDSPKLSSSLPLTIPPKKSRGKGSQGKKTADTTEATVDVYEESDPEPVRIRSASRRVVKKKVTITADDNIIPKPNIALELGKFMSLTDTTKKEAARQVHATHARIVTELIPEPARKRPSGISFKNTSSVSRKISSDPSQKLNGVQTLTPEEQIATDMMKALKERVPDESTIILATSSEGTGTKPGVPDEENVTSEANAILEWGSEQKSEYSEKDNDDETIKWVDIDDEEEKKDNDNDKSIDLEQKDDEETNDEFVHGEEHVQDDDEETDDENGDEEVTNAAKVDAGKTEEVKDDAKKAELPSTSSSLSDTTNTEINSLLDFKIQYEVPHIQSPPVLTVPVFVISTYTRNSFSGSWNNSSTPSICLHQPLVLLQTKTPIPLPPIITEAPTITTVVPESDALTAVQLRVAKLKKDVSELKKIDHTAKALASLKYQVPTVVEHYIGSKIGDDLQKVL
ncbi:hypothetical protein Tco_0370162 [Tanacetum coccineum]